MSIKLDYHGKCSHGNVVCGMTLSEESKPEEVAMTLGRWVMSGFTVEPVTDENRERMSSCNQCDAE